MAICFSQSDHRSQEEAKESKRATSYLQCVLKNQIIGPIPLMVRFPSATKRLNHSRFEGQISTFVDQISGGVLLLKKNLSSSAIRKLDGAYRSRKHFHLKRARAIGCIFCFRKMIGTSGWQRILSWVAPFASSISSHRFRAQQAPALHWKSVGNIQAD